MLCTAKKGGGSAYFQHSARCASKWWQPILHEASRTTGNPMLCYAGERLGVAFSDFLRCSGSFGSAVTNISGSTGYLTSETIKGSVEWSRHERHFSSLLPYFLLSWLQIFQLFLSFWTSSFDLVLLKKFLQEKKNIRKTTKNALAPGIFIVLSILLKLGTQLLHIQAQNTLLQNF